MPDAPTAESASAPAGSPRLTAGIAAGICIAFSAVSAHQAAQIDYWSMDSYNYLSLAHTMVHHGQWRLGLDGPDSEFAPGLPLHLMPAMAAGVPGEAAAIGLSAVAAGLTLWVTYLFARRVSNPILAVAVVALLAILPGWGRWMLGIMTEPLFSLYLIVAAYCLHRAGESQESRWLWVGSGLLGMAGLVRFAAVPAAPALLLLAWPLFRSGGKWQPGTFLLASSLAAGPAVGWLVLRRLVTTDDYFALNASKSAGLQTAWENLRYYAVSFPLEDLILPGVPLAILLHAALMLALWWLCLGILAWGAIESRQRLSLAVGLALAATLLFLLGWFFRTERFLTPLMPLVGVAVAAGSSSLPTSGRRVLAVMAAATALSAIAASPTAWKAHRRGVSRQTLAAAVDSVWKSAREQATQGQGPLRRRSAAGRVVTNIDPGIVAWLTGEKVTMMDPPPIPLPGDVWLLAAMGDKMKSPGENLALESLSRSGEVVRVQLGTTHVVLFLPG